MYASLNAAAFSIEHVIIGGVEAGRFVPFKMHQVQQYNSQCYHNNNKCSGTNARHKASNNCIRLHIKGTSHS